MCAASTRRAAHARYTHALCAPMKRPGGSHMAWAMTLPQLRVWCPRNQCMAAAVHMHLWGSWATSLCMCTRGQGACPPRRARAQAAGGGGRGRARLDAARAAAVRGRRRARRGGRRAGPRRARNRAAGARARTAGRAAGPRGRSQGAVDRRRRPGLQRRAALRPTGRGRQVRRRRFRAQVAFDCSPERPARLAARRQQPG